MTFFFKKKGLIENVDGKTILILNPDRQLSVIPLAPKAINPLKASNARKEKKRKEKRNKILGPFARVACCARRVRTMVDG